MIFLCRFLKILRKRLGIITQEMFEESESERNKMILQKPHNKILSFSSLIFCRENVTLSFVHIMCLISNLSESLASLQIEIHDALSSIKNIQGKLK